jgi:hypothetical protein
MRRARIFSIVPTLFQARREAIVRWREGFIVLPVAPRQGAALRWLN